MVKKILIEIREFLYKIVISNRYTFLLWKGIKSLFTQGFGVTWQKVRGRLRGANFIYHHKSHLYTKKELQRQKGIKFPKDIKFSILVPLYNTGEDYLEQMIRSVTEQTYGNWELCLADGSDEAHSSVGQVCK